MDKKARAEIINKFAHLVQEADGEAYYVGGYVRDALLGIPSKDVDIEVHGIEPSVLVGLIEQVGTPLTIGKSFGIHTIKGTDIDIAMPREERAIGNGHRDFDVSVNPYLGTYKASERRDYTVNAIMKNVVTGEIIDHFGGVSDLRKGILRHVDSRFFADDPLRVLRGAQFASRFGFEIADETIEICKGIDLSSLSKERVDEELKKALTKGEKPSLFFEALRKMGKLDVWFKELTELIGLEQDPTFHPEGDVWVHTMEVIDRGAKLRSKASDPYSFMLLCLTHDLGKIVTTEFVKGRIHAYEHEIKGLPLVNEFICRITNDKSIIGYVNNMVPLHMRPNILAYQKSSLKATNRMFDAAIAPLDLILFSKADKPVVSGGVPYDGDANFLMERYELFEDIMARPYVTGLDLIQEGLKPGEYFNDVLSYSHKLRLAGIDKKTTLKQTLAYARKYKEK